MTDLQSDLAALREVLKAVQNNPYALDDNAVASAARSSTAALERLIKVVEEYTAERQGRKEGK